MKYYPPSNHIYYEDSDVPINKLNIKDSLLIHELEKEQLIKSYEILHNELSENTVFDMEYLQKVNNLIFAELYEWAGAYRSINISKGESMFYPYLNLETFSTDIFSKLKDDKYILASIECMNADCELMQKDEIFIP